MGSIKIQELNKRIEDKKKLELNKAQEENQKGGVVYEPSIVEKDGNEESSSGDYEGRIDFNVKSQEHSEVSREDLVSQREIINLYRNKANSFSYKKSVKEVNGIHSYKTVQTEIDDDFPQENKRRDLIDRELLRKRIDRGDQDEQTADISCNIPLQTGEPLFMKALILFYRRRRF